MIEFNRFSAQAFEQLVQALSAQVLGPGTVVFGTGPDGGREATFEGEVNYPSGADRWKAYIVFKPNAETNFGILLRMLIGLQAN